MRLALTKAGLISALIISITVGLVWVLSFDTGSLSSARAYSLSIIVPAVTAFPSLTYIFLQHIKLKVTHEKLEKAHFELQARSRMDHMTELLNREALFDSMKISRSRIDNGAIIVIDADYFKCINDTFGHSTGDRALKLIAFALQNVTRKGDLVGRIGGEEFCVFLPGANMETGVNVAERIRTEVENTPFYVTDNKLHPLTISLSVAAAPKNESNSQILSRADRYLYLAKERGRNTVVSDEKQAVDSSSKVLNFHENRSAARN